MLATLKKNKWVYLVAVALLLLLILLPTHLLVKKTNILTLIGIYTMVTVGLCLLMGYTGQASLGQAAFFGTGAYLYAVLSTTHHVNPWLSMLIATIATGAFAYLVGFPILRLRGNYLAMATLGLGIIMWILFTQLSRYTGGPDGLQRSADFSMGGFVFNSNLRRYLLVWFFTVCVLLISLNIVRSRAGRALRAIHSSEAAAESVGVNASGFKLKIFVLSAVYASLAGSLYANLRAIGPGSFDFMASVMVITMASVGGLASVWGAVFGAAAITYISQVALVDLGQRYSRLAGSELIIYGLTLMLIMIFMPKGLFVSLRDAIDSWRRKRAQRGAAT